MRKPIFVLVLVSALGAAVACSGNRRGVSDASVNSVTVFGDEISLEGYAIHPKDGHTAVELRWTAVRKPTADYSAFVHAVDSSGGIVFQFDHPLKNAAGKLTSAWAAGDTVTTGFLATPPPAHTAGAYPLRIGVYVPNPMKLLQITKSGFPQPKGGWNDHAIMIENVACN